MKIVSSVALAPEQRAAIAGAAPGAELIDRQCRSREDIEALVGSGCDVLMTFHVPSSILAPVARVRWLQLLTAGADHVLKQPADLSRIVITHTSGIHSVVIAQHVFASILAFNHRFHLTLRAQLRHEWLEREPFMAGVHELRGKTIGIIGYGSLGREVARIAQAFGMSVLALKREPKKLQDEGWVIPGTGDPDGSIPREIFGPDQREELLARSDYVVITLPHTKDTYHFIGARELAAMKPQAYLVNVGRGELIDQQALVEALMQKRIAGVGLDVFEREPLDPQSPLWDFEQAILTPHIAGSFSGYMDRACELFVENLRRFVAGRPLVNQVDLSRGY